jgi:hypothetical protein
LLTRLASCSLIMTGSISTSNEREEAAYSPAVDEPMQESDQDWTFDIYGEHDAIYIRD